MLTHVYLPLSFTENYNNTHTNPSPHSVCVWGGFSASPVHMRLRRSVWLKLHLQKRSHKEEGFSLTFDLVFRPRAALMLLPFDVETKQPAGELFSLQLLLGGGAGRGDGGTGSACSSLETPLRPGGAPPSLRFSCSGLFSLQTPTRAVKVLHADISSSVIKVARGRCSS